MALFSPLVLDYTEMMLAGGSWQLQHNGLAAAYAPPLTPYLLPGVQYPPLFFSLMTLLSWLTGLSPIASARFWSYSGYVAAAVMAALLIHQESKVEGQKSKVRTKNKEVRIKEFRSPFHESGKGVRGLGQLDTRYSLLSTQHLALSTQHFLSSSFILHPSSFALLPFCFWPVIIFIHTARVDPLALFFSLLGVWVYRRGAPDSNKILFSRLILVAAILAMAAFTKQTYLVAPAAIFFHLLLSHQNRVKALGFGISYAGLVVVGYGLFDLLSGGELWGIFEAARASRFIFDLAPGIVGFFLLDHLPLLIIALLTLIWQWRRGQKFYPIYAFLALLSCFTIIKDGAIDYYFTELAYIVVIQVGIAVQFFLSNLPPSVRLDLVFTIAGRGVRLLLFLQCLIALGMLVGWSQTNATANFRAAYNEGVGLVTEAKTQNQPALVLADGLLIETGQYYKVGDYLIYSILLSSGSRDVSPLLADLQTKHWQLIVTVDPKLYRWSDDITGLLDRNYKLRVLKGADGTGLYWVYQAK